jgi:predicted nucleotide-binding protein
MASEKQRSKLRVFISYSQNDAEWARSFADALTKRGVDVWFDKLRIRVGEPIREALESGLRSSDVFVTLVDPKFPGKPTLFFELGAAIGMGKRVVAIVPKDYPAAELPLELRLRQYLTRDSPEETAQELSESLTAA